MTLQTFSVFGVDSLDTPIYMNHYDIVKVLGSCGGFDLEVIIEFIYYVRNNNKTILGMSVHKWIKVDMYLNDCGGDPKLTLYLRECKYIACLYGFLFVSMYNFKVLLQSFGRSGYSIEIFISNLRIYLFFPNAARRASKVIKSCYCILDRNLLDWIINPRSSGEAVSLN